MALLFLWCCAIGCGLLLLALVADGLLDALDVPFLDGALPVVSAALGVFGATGMLLSSLLDEQVATALALGVPLVAGLLAGWATRALWRRLKRDMPRNAVAPTAAELVGARVKVLWWRQGRGEVSARTRGHQLTLPAVSDEPLHLGAEAVVLSADDGVLQVTTLRLEG